MSDLFEQDAGHAPGISLPGASLQFYPSFLPPDVADGYLRALLSQTSWRDEKVFVWGKWHQQPRRVAWYGDAGTSYTYSGRTLEPLPWTELLEELRQLIEAKTGASFNSVLLNLYRDQNDSMGWHSDNEPELGPTPTIASLSLGDAREFLFKHRQDKAVGIRRIVLPNGSLLVMFGDTQKNWLHAIEKERHPCGARINLTFRRIFPVRSRRQEDCLRGARDY